MVIQEFVDEGKITTFNYPIPLFKCLFKVFFCIFNPWGFKHVQSTFPYFDLGSVGH
jgi:hypothetical protein